MRTRNGKSFNLIPARAPLIAALFVTLLASCGLEDYPFIDAIPQGNVAPEFNSRATIRIPDNYSGSPFTHFAVFYRIYVSDTPLMTTTSTSTFSSINPTLVSDYNTVSPYIDSTTHVNVNMDSLFSGRGYKYLSLRDENINTVLSSSALGSTVVFDFPSARAPTMTIGGRTYTLWRSDGNGVFDPKPDRLFVNSEELWKSENITSQFNADVVNKSGIADTDRHYTYAAMFIVAVGINAASYSNIYSTPSLIHVFQLPDQW